MGHIGENYLLSLFLPRASQSGAFLESLPRWLEGGKNDCKRDAHGYCGADERISNEVLGLVDRPPMICKAYF